MFLCSGVTAASKEVLSGTDAVVISCEVTGLTKKASVQWVNSDDDDVTTLTTATYVVEQGELSDAGTQTTTLTVPSGPTTADKDYTCQITPASPDDIAPISKTASLNIFSKLGVFKILLNAERFID